MPMSHAFQERLFPHLRPIADHFGTPFHIYDEAGILDTGSKLVQAFSQAPSFREYFAVKALPNPAILKIMRNMGFGFDCSSIPELILARETGASGENIMFTSNNTTAGEFEAALSAGGCILNLDDITLIDKVPRMPELICFRYNPGPKRTGNFIIGNPVEAKYGVSDEQIVDAYGKARERGAKRFGLHTMVCSNELNYRYMVETVHMLLDLVERISGALNITFEFINMGGGLGIPYRPDQEALDIQTLGKEVAGIFNAFREKNDYSPSLYMESGRYITGPHGALAVTAINHKNIYRDYIGVDACMSALMRPAIYGAYHHLSVLDKSSSADRRVYDVVGSLCENNDKFAVQRELPAIEESDILVIHDTGAHGHAMGFNYNGRLRPRELLLKKDGSVELVRRAETIDDYFATLNFEKDEFRPS